MLRGGAFFRGHSVVIINDLYARATYDMSTAVCRTTVGSILFGAHDNYCIFCWPRVRMQWLLEVTTSLM